MALLERHAVRVLDHYLNVRVFENTPRPDRDQRGQGGYRDEFHHPVHGLTLLAAYMPKLTPKAKPFWPATVYSAFTFTTE